MIDSHDLGAAKIYLLYNGAKNCVVTWKDKPNSTYVATWLQRYSDGKIVGEDGNFSTYAGPKWLSAAGTCVAFGR